MEIKKSNMSFISQVFKLIPRDRFMGLVNKHNSDAGCKGFTSWTHFSSLLFAQLTGADSLRDLVGGVASAPGRFQELFMDTMPTKSSLSYNGQRRPWELFKDVFDMILDEIRRRTPNQKSPFKFQNPVYSMDSTTISLCLSLYDWAKYKTGKGGIKVHTLLNHSVYMPEVVCITEAKEHDVNAARTITLTKGSIVVADRGYVDYKLFFKWNQEGVFFVTRAKEGMAYKVIKTMALPKAIGRPKKEPDIDAAEAKNGLNQPSTSSKKGKKGNKKPQNSAERKLMGKNNREPTTILKDEHINFSSKQASEDCPITLRLVTAWDPVNERKFEFLTNNLTLSPRTIAELYRNRWEVELFFKCIKQDLVILSFLGTSENAVRLQIYAALTAVVLVKYLQFMANKVIWNFSNLFHLLRLNWFTYLDIYKWLNVPHCDRRPPPSDAPSVQHNKLF
jgi:hypothetical protein